MGRRRRHGVRRAGQPFALLRHDRVLAGVLRRTILPPHAADHVEALAPHLRHVCPKDTCVGRVADRRSDRHSAMLDAWRCCGTLAAADGGQWS
jgi:hypothetical protein